MHEQAVAADIGDKGWLHGFELITRKIALAERGHVEIDKFGKRTAAEPAGEVITHRQASRLKQPRPVRNIR
jgi:hypothetical protein